MTAALVLRYDLSMYPWIDYQGRFSPLRATVLAALFLPAVYVAIAYKLDWLGSRPWTEAIHQIGLWTIRLIFIALTISPARRILNWPRLIEVRRMVGVAACCYVLVHLCLYIIDEAFDFGMVASEIVLRIYLTIGFTALVGLAVLAATSNDGMVRRLGRRWQRLHYLVYPIGILAIIHYYIQSKADIWEPFWMSGLFAWLMGWRVLDWLAPRRQTAPLWQVAALSLLAAVLTGLGETLYYTIARNAPFWRLVETNFSMQIGVRPSWIVLGVCLLFTLAGWLRRFSGPARPSPARNRASAARGA
jgi:sulfoxide reductase heme-binding subunit YedZ